MKHLTSLLLLLTAAATLSLAQEPAKPEPVKPGTPGPKVAADAAAKLAESVPADAVVLSVGDDKLTKAQFESLLAQLPDQARAAAQGPNRRKVADQIADLKAMAQEARKRKIDQQPGVQQLVRLQSDQALAGVLFKEIQGSVKVDDAALHAYYDQHKAQYEEAKASHILIRFQGSSVPLRAGEKDLSQEEALAKITDIRKKLVAGGSFSDMAKAESDDTGSGANGGSLGTFGHGQMVPEFEKVAFTAPVGQISEPIKTQFGYHIVKVEERKSKTFDEVKDEIAKQMKPQQAQQQMEDIRSHSGIVISDDYFGK
jgi:peptidyl-prolyl cis-trans isomerase C